MPVFWGAWLSLDSQDPPVDDLDQTRVSPLALKLGAVIRAQWKCTAGGCKTHCCRDGLGYGESGWNVIGFADEASHATAGFNFSV